MKKLLSLIFILLAVCWIRYTPVFADFDRAYQDYLYQSDQYRQALTNFLTAKNRYLTYKTLTSQTEALNATKAFLEARDQVLITYLQMLIEKNPQEAFKKLLNGEIVFFSDHKNLIPAIGSLEDAVRLSQKTEDHYPATEVLARQTITDILLTKVQIFDNRLKILEVGFEEKINLAKGQGKDVTTAERWLLETKNKRLLARDKLNKTSDLSEKLKPTKYSSQASEEFRKIQTSIFEANQYLKEAVAYLKEIKEELKYGNY